MNYKNSKPVNFNDRVIGTTEKNGVCGGVVVNIREEAPGKPERIGILSPLVQSPVTKNGTGSVQCIDVYGKPGDFVLVEDALDAVSAIAIPAAAVSPEPSATVQK